MPAIKYQLKDGTRVSGTTTIISSNLGWSRGALMYWAWNEGKEGRDFRETRDKAADAGTIAHGMIEADLKDRSFNTSIFPKELVDKAETSYLNFIEWKERNQVKPIAIEPNLISEIYQYGATPDYIGYINGKASLLDWKTGGVYEDHLLQVAAYKVAWEEVHPEIPLDGGFNLIRFNKEDAAFDHKFRQSLPEAWEAFLNLLNLHNLHKKIKKMI